jgi:hypothetical protein
MARYHHHATMTASVWRPVTCEHCKADFAYLMTRSGQGHAQSGLFVGFDEAKQGARGGAEISLEKKLEEDFDPVACPDCGNYQEYMFHLLRKRKFTWMKRVGAAGLLAGLFFLVARRLFFHLLHRQFELPSEVAFPGSWAIVLLPPVVGVALLFGYKRLMETFDPNRDADRRARRDLSQVRTLLRRKDYERALERANPDEQAKLARISWKGATNVARIG